MTDLIPLAIFAAGCLFGAWLHWRGGRGQSPLPGLPERASKEQAKEVAKFPQVKP